MTDKSATRPVTIEYVAYLEARVTYAPRTFEVPAEITPENVIDWVYAQGEPDWGPGTVDRLEKGLIDSEHHVSDPLNPDSIHENGREGKDTTRCDMDHCWATVTKHDWFMTRGKTPLSASFSDIEVCRNCGCVRRNGKDDQPCEPRPLPDFEEIYRVRSSPLETRVCMVCKAEVRCQSWVPEPMMCEPCLEENEAMEIRAEALDDEI